MAADLAEGLLRGVDTRRISERAIRDGWQRIEGVKRPIILLNHPTDELTQIQIPTSGSPRDLAFLMGDAVRKLAEYEKREPAEVLSELTLPPADLVRLTLTSTEIDAGTLPINQALAMLQGGRDLLAAAACAAERPSAYFESMDLPGVDMLLDDCRMLPSDRDLTSYGVSFLVPVAPAPALPDGQRPPFDAEPIGRRATLVLARALQALRIVLDERRTDGLAGVVERGVSANLCEALARISDVCHYAMLECSVSWSEERSSRPFDVSNRSKFLYTDSGHLKRVAQQLMKSRSLAVAAASGSGGMARSGSLAADEPITPVDDVASSLPSASDVPGRDPSPIRPEIPLVGPAAPPQVHSPPRFSVSTTSKTAPASGDGTIPGEIKENGFGMSFCWCPPGTFRMGSPEDEPGRFNDEGPVEVTLTQGFWMGRDPVTQAQWTRVMGTTLEQQKAKSRLTLLEGGGPDHPMYYVSHDEAEEFCRRLTEMAHETHRLPFDREYRLPTEAQWEYACRAGTVTAYAFGNSITNEQANFGWNVRATTPIGSYPANAWGLRDMHGNVWEWCRDRSGKTLPGGVDPCVDDVISASRVIRGGSWRNVAHYVRAGYRDRYGPSYRSRYLGFRCAEFRRASARGS